MVEQQRDNNQRIVLFMVLLNAFTTPLMLSAVNVALPDIARSLSLNAIMLSWVPMAYLMASAMFLLLFGRLADIYGRKRIFLCGTFFVIVTSALAAMADSAAGIIVGRFLQGVSAAMLYATQIAIISSVYPAQRRGQVVGMTVSAIYLGLGFGPFIGGLLIDEYGWRSSFLLHIPLAFIVLFIGLTKVSSEWLADEPGSLDIKGALVYAIGIVLLCIGVTLLPYSLGYILLIASLAILWFFLKFQNSIVSPLLNTSLFFTNRVFTFSCIASLIMYTATFANVVLISLYLQYLKGLSATATGMIMMVQPITMALFSPIVGRVADHKEPKIIATVGVVITIVGLILFAAMDQSTSITQVLVALVTTGIGFSFFSSPNVVAIMSSVEKKSYGSATAVMASMRILGQLTSMVLVALFFSIVMGEVEITQDVYPQLQQTIRHCFSVAAILCLAAIVFSMKRGNLRDNRLTDMQ